MGGFQLRIFMRNLFTNVLKCRNLSYFSLYFGHYTLSQYMRVSLCYLIVICNYLESTWPFNAPPCPLQINLSSGPRLRFAEVFTDSWLNRFRKYGGLTFPSDHGGAVLVENKKRACMALDQPISSPHTENQTTSKSLGMVVTLHLL